MPKVLILFAHPILEKSRVHKQLINGIINIEGVTFHDLYELYPDFDINIKKEQQLLLEHDVIIWQHPLYWYSAPAIIKQWMDLVLEHGWAYGTTGNMLAGKYILNVLTSGGPESAYARNGRNRFTIREFMAPFEQTAVLCKMNYLPPFVIHGTHKLTADAIAQFTAQYKQLLNYLITGQLFQMNWQQLTYFNEIVSTPEKTQK